MNSVSQLNEECQCKCISPPTYTFLRVGGDDHAPQFQCKVRVLSKTQVGPVCPNKKLAKEGAAALFLQKPDVPKTMHHVHLDVENRPKELDKLLEMHQAKSFDHLTVYAATAWPGIDQVAEKCNGNATLETVNSGNRSAADVAIITRVASLIKTPGKHTIVSSDKLFYAFIDVVSDRYPAADVSLVHGF